VGCGALALSLAAAKVCACRRLKGRGSSGRSRMAKGKDHAEAVKVVCSNKKARRDYHIEETVEAGLVLWGNEVKSLRESKANMGMPTPISRGAKVWLSDLHISPYSHGRMEEQDPLRDRKLLLHAAEIRKLALKVEQRGYSLIRCASISGGASRRWNWAWGRARSSTTSARHQAAGCGARDGPRGPAPLKENGRAPRRRFRAILRGVTIPLRHISRLLKT